MKPYTWRAAILKSDLPPTTRHVLLTLSCYVNDAGGSAYPSTKTLADDTGLSERAVITHLKFAVEASWLKINKHGFAGQRWARNEYYPSTPSGDFDTEGTEGRSAASGKALNVATEGTERRSKGTERDDKKALKDVQSNSPIEITKELSKEIRRGQAAPDDDFNALQYLLDKGVSQKVAKDWLKLRKGKNLEAIETAFDGVLREAESAGLTMEQAITICCERGWGNFKAKWLAADGKRTEVASAWWATPQTKLAKALEVGAGAALPGESESAWTARIQAAIDGATRMPAQRPTQVPTKKGQDGEEKRDMSPEAIARRKAALGAALNRKAGPA